MDNDVKEYVCRVIGVPFDTPDDYDYRKSGNVDSLGLVRVVLTLEAKFCLMFSDEDVSRPEFNTAGGLVKIVEGKLNGV
jgi:acyl carrier protein